MPTRGEVEAAVRAAVGDPVSGPVAEAIALIVDAVEGVYAAPDVVERRVVAPKETR